jgi:heme/copper-type cytochrome/quinol oxidase subunit 1
MYTLVRRFIKTGVAFLALGIALGFWLLVRRELWLVGPHPAHVSAHAHALLAGFVLFLILGVALWLFPRPPKEDTRYRPALAEASYWVLVLGTGLRVGAELARGWEGAEWQRWAIVLGGAGQVVGLGIYFWTMWPRIRGVGSQLREARGERF